ncbi:MAG TPA: hypothetical protein VGM41_02155 [Chitinophagaceae bacterium]|jgi:hypothetical protein
MMESMQFPGEITIGSIDPMTGKKVIQIVSGAEDFVIYITENNSLNCHFSGEHEFQSNISEMLGKIKLTEALVDRIFLGKRNRFAYKLMLGSALSRLIEDKESTNVKKTLAIIDARIMEHCKARVRMAYIYYAFTTVLLLGVFFGILFILKTRSTSWLDDVKYHILVGIGLGGIGSFITTFFRFQNYSGSVVSGLAIHRLDGFLRIFYGLVAALLITFAIKGDVIVGFSNKNNDNQPWLYYFLCMVAGASEILVPNLIKQTEQGLSKDSEKRQDNTVPEENKSDALKEQENTNDAN